MKTVICLLSTLLTAVHVHGQGVQPLVTLPQSTQTKPESTPQREADVQVDRAKCTVFLFEEPFPDWRRQLQTEQRDATTTLLHCLQSDIAAMKNGTAADTRRLVKQHVNYKRYKGWVNRAVSDLAQLRRSRPDSWQEETTSVGALRNALDTLDEAVHEALENRGLRDPLSAMLFTGASFADAGNAAAGGGNGNGGTKKPEGTPIGPSAHIAFESPHFGDDERRWVHFGFGGKLGFQQILTMVKPTAEGGTEPTDATPVAEYKDGLMWSIGATAYALSRATSEAFIRLSLGGTRIGDARSVLEGDEGQGFIAVPVDADDSLSAPRWEVGLGWNYYGRPMEVAHIEKGLLNPAFSAYVLYRTDRRFRGEGDLASFASPERRWVYGVSVNLRNLVRSDGAEVPTSGPNTFDFGFSVEREFSRGSGLRIPDATRYVLRGEVNLLRALAGTPTAKEAEKPAADGAKQ